MNHFQRLLFIGICLAAVPASAQLGAVGGVYIDPQGMLRETASLSPDEQLKLLRREALESAHSAEFKPAAGLRKVSLKLLERAVAECHAQETPLPAELRYLAGLQRVQFVFFDAEGGDVILAGPAEGWRQNPTGEVVGQKSGQPVLHLDDLIVCLRHVFADQTAPFLGVSIEPTAPGMKSYAAFMQSLPGIDGNRLPDLLRGMERAMGPQDVKLYGMPESSRAALILLAADYRLKRISMGHEPAPVRRFVSYFDMVAKNQQGNRAPQHRFWFVGKYDSVLHSPDELAWTFEGSGVRVQTAPSDGSFKGAPDKPSKPATLFVENFTKQFPEIAAQVPVFLELRNVVNLAVVAGIIRRVADERDQADDDAKKVWTPGHFADAKACALATYPAPKQVPSLANVVRREGSWMFSVSGGVDVNTSRLLDPERVRVGDERIASARAAAITRRGDAWWWD